MACEYCSNYFGYQTSCTGFDYPWGHIGYELLKRAELEQDPNQEAELETALAESEKRSSFLMKAAGVSISAGVIGAITTHRLEILAAGIAATLLSGLCWTEETESFNLPLRRQLHELRHNPLSRRYRI